MAKYKARDIFNLSINDTWEVFKGPNTTHTVVFDDDKEYECKSKEIIYTRYIWDMYEYTREIPLLYESTLTHYLLSQPFLAKTHIKLLEYNFKFICNYLNLKTYESKEFLLKQAYKITNNIYNDLLFRISDYMATIDATDFIDVVNMPEIKEIHANIEPHPDSIENAYKKIKQHLNSVDSKDNMFIEAYKSRTIDENQANQCIGPRGFVTDVDRTVYKVPVMNGFIKGLSNIYEVAVESRTAAKSHIANDKQISTSEYMSRRIQLMSMSVERVIPGDCGSTEYMEFMVKENALHNLKGIYYLDTDNVLKTIKGDEKHLVNNIIKIRTALGCKLSNPHHVCSTCLGELSLNLPSNSNIGNAFTMRVTKDLTQTLLSTKHLTHSVKNNTITITDNATKYFIAKEDNLYLRKDLPYSTLSIVIAYSQIPKLTDVLNLSHNKIATSKIGDITEVMFVQDAHKKQSKETVSVCYNDRVSNITKEFFNYIKATEPRSDQRGNFVIDLGKWNPEEPIFNMPLKEKSMLNFVNKIASIIETEKDKIKDPYEKLDILFTECNNKFNINLTLLQVLIYATTTYNEENNDYSLARGSLRAQTTSRNTVMKSRSLSQFYAFEKQINDIFLGDGSIFNPRYRQDHPFDVFFDPNGVLTNK